MKTNIYKHGDFKYLTNATRGFCPVDHTVSTWWLYPSAEVSLQEK